MAKAGRRRSVVWECFVEHPSSDKRRVLCRFCNHDTVANPTRMVRHILKYCPHVDEAHKKICREYESLPVAARRRESAGGSAASAPKSDLETENFVPDSPRASVEHHAPLPPLALPASAAATTSAPFEPPSAPKPELVAPASRASPSRPPVVTSASTASSHAAPAPAVATPLDSADVERVHNDLVRALVTQTAPGATPDWSLLDNAHFQRAFAVLRPDFALVSAQDAQQVVFPRLHAAVAAQRKQLLASATTLTLLCTTSSSSGSDATRLLQWFGIDQDARCELLAVTPSVPHDEAPAALAARVRAFIKQQLPPSVATVHVCTDSFGAWPRARALLEPSDVAGAAPLALTGGCMMQQTLLVLHDAIESLTSVRAALEQCIALASFIERCAPLQRDLAQQSLPTPPVPTQLHSYIACVRETLALQDALQRAVHSNAAYWTATPRADTAAAIVRDESFWSALALTRDIFAPLGALLVLSDARHATSGQLFLCWLAVVQSVAMPSPLVPASDKEQFTRRVVERIRAWTDDHVVAALVLDPRVHALGLSALGKRKARGIISDLAAKRPAPNRARVIEHLLQYLAREGPFDDDDASWRMMASLPRLFWLEYRDELPELAAVALSVLGVHAHVLPLEETWHAFAQQQRAETDASSATASDAATVLAVEQVKCSATKSVESSSSRANTSSSSSSSADTALAQSLAKYRACLDASPLTKRERASHAGRDVPRETEASSSRADTLEQLRSWLAHYSDAAAPAAATANASSSLQRFDVDWLDLSPECAERVRACVASFTRSRDANV